MVVRMVPALAALAASLSLSCAATYEEPPAPPAAPVDPAAFSQPARPPAPDVDLSGDLDGGNRWADSAASAAGAGTSTADAGTAPSIDAGSGKKKRP
jgi:hypothetical protein